MEAKLRTGCYWYDYAGITVQIRAEDSGNAAPYSSSNQPWDRPLTSAAVTWHKGTCGYSLYYSPNFASVIQEVVNRSDWHSGNAISILLFDAGSSICHMLTAYEANNSYERAHLIIKYWP